MLNTMKDELNKAYNSSDASGRHCKYVKLNSTVGIKFYSDKEKAIQSFAMQKLLHNLGLAPDCWAWGSMKTAVSFYGEAPVECEIFYFMTGHCQVFETYNSFDRTYGVDTFDELVREPIDEILKSFGIFNTDSCVFNFGLMGEKFVVIDCADVELAPNCLLSA